MVAVCDRYSTTTANTMLTTIVSIQPKDSSGSGGETRESVVYRLADDMLEKLPADFVEHEVSCCTRQYSKESFSFYVLLKCINRHISGNHS